jgi:CSLREA domain-containing protein
VRGTFKGFAIAAIASLSLAAPAAAKTYEVTKRGDPAPDACKKKDCSLREAVIAANGHAGADRIVLPKRKTYSLSIENSVPPGEDEAAEGDLDVTDSVSIGHPGKGRAKVDANGIDRVFELFAPTTTVKKLGVVGGVGDVSSGGGGILMVSDSDLTLARSVVKNNTSEADGGGIDGNDGVIVIRRSKIVGNSAEFEAGGIHFFSEASEPSRLVKSTIAGNSAEGQGGGVLVSAQSVSIESSTISGNDVAGANGKGGGIGVDGPDGRLLITNSTLTENGATGPGGGLYFGVGDRVDANAVTVARNSAKFGGGLYNGSLQPFEIENSLIALNQASADGDDCTSDGAEGTPFDFDSLGHNLLGTDADCFGFDATGDFVNSNPKIGGLKNNGGPTQTIALKKGSPAINKANKASAPKKDQRGVKRGKKPDIGAYERVKKKKHRHRR